MKKNYIKKSLYLATIFLSALLLPSFKFAKAQVTIQSIVTNILLTVTYVAITITVIAWIITGLMFLSALGDPNKIGNARRALIFAIVGTAISLLAGTARFLVAQALGVP